MSLRTLIYSSSTSSSTTSRLNTPVTDNYGCAHSTSFHLSINVQSLSSWVFQRAPGYSTLLLLCRCPVSHWQPLLITISFLHPVHTFFLSLSKPLLLTFSASPIALSQCSSCTAQRERHLCRRAAAICWPAVSNATFFSPCNRLFSRQGNTSGDVLPAW